MEKFLADTAALADFAIATVSGRYYAMGPGPALGKGRESLFGDGGWGRGNGA